MHVVLIGAELEENLATRSLHGALQAHGHTVQHAPFDGRADLERTAAAVCASGAAIAGFSMVFTRRGREFADLIQRCRELGFSGTTVAGGHFAAFHAEQLLRDVPGLDAIAVGEGEPILCALASEVGDRSTIAGLVWRDGDRVRRNPPATAVQELDTLAWPVHRRPFDAYLGLPIVNVLGSRGCRYSCAFCSIAAWHKLCGGARYRVRSAGDLAAEMGCLWREGVRIFNFHDDNFLGADREENLTRARSLRAALQEQGVGRFAFQVKARPDAIDPELFALLRSMGLFRVFLGIEAGSDASLRHLGRGQTVEDNERALAVLHGLDLHIAFNLLVLNPESTLDDLEANVVFMRRHADTPLNFCRTEVYAGTPLEARLAAQGRLHGDYWGQDYTIADPKAQQAFEMAIAAFWDRNFGPHPLHYLSGQVDYEHQLRADFFGTHPALRALAKGFIREVNENTSSHLLDTIHAIRAGEAGPAFARRLAERVAQDDVRLAREGRLVLERIRDLPAVPKKASRSNAAIAASLAVALAGCPSPAPQVMEAAPEPLVAEPHRQDAGAIGPQVMEAAPYPTYQPDSVIVTSPDASAPDASNDGGASDGAADARPEGGKKAKPDAGKPPAADAAVPAVTLDPTHMREAAPPPPDWRMKKKD